ncbi:MAG: hypothetical protein K940chlam9_00454 [Chlamydiae bacterium]|nr:hypothetical protein [Chlamydiota bacterium]
MIIESIGNCTNSGLKGCSRNTTITLDWITAIALLTLGILGAVGVLSISPPVSYAFIGAGSVYTATMILNRLTCCVGLHN